MWKVNKSDLDELFDSLQTIRNQSTSNELDKVQSKLKRLNREIERYEIARSDEVLEIGDVSFGLEPFVKTRKPEPDAKYYLSIEIPFKLNGNLDDEPYELNVFTREHRLIETARQKILEYINQNKEEVESLLSRISPSLGYGGGFSPSYNKNILSIVLPLARECYTIEKLIGYVNHHFQLEEQSNKVSFCIGVPFQTKTLGIIMPSGLYGGIDDQVYECSTLNVKYYNENNESFKIPIETFLSELVSPL